MAHAIAPSGHLVLVSYDVAHLIEGTGGPKNPDHLLDPPVLAAELESLGLKVTRAETVRQVDAVNAVIHAVNAPSSPP